MNEKITTGELAKKANVTVRTLQYYDKIDLLKPTSISEGGRRLYHTNDLIVLHQIITLKSLGLSLKEIKERLVPIDSNNDIKNLLTRQANIIEEQLSKYNKILDSIKMISDDIEESNDVDWEKYSHMVQLIQENNEHYWMMNYLDKEIMENISEVHKHHTEDEIPTDWLVKMMMQVVQLINKGILPEDKETQEIAKEIWLIINKYAGGDKKILSKLHKFYSQGDKWPENYKHLQEKTFSYIQEAIDYYLLHHKNRKDTK